MIFCINGSLGDVVAFTAIPREYHKQHPDHQIQVETNHPEVFRHNPHVVPPESSMYDARGDRMHFSLGASPAGNLVHTYGRMAGIKIYDSQPEMFLVEADRVSMGTVRPKAVAIDTWAGWPRRRWPWARFAELSRRLLVDGWEVLEVGANTRDCFGNQRPQCQLPNCRSFYNQLSVRQTAAVLEKCRLYIGNESGLAHLAAAVGTRSVVISTQHWYNFAYRTTYPVVNLAEDCARCDELCKQSPGCLDAISVDDVLAVVAVADAAW